MGDEITYQHEQLMSRNLARFGKLLLEMTALVKLIGTMIAHVEVRCQVGTV